MEMFSATFQNKAILPELPRSVQPNIRLSNDGFREIEQPQNKEVAGNTPNSFVSSFKLSNKNDIDPAKQSFSFASSPPMKLPVIPPNQNVEKLGFTPNKPKLTFAPCSYQTKIQFETQKEEEKKQNPTEIAIAQMIDSAGGVSKVDDVIDYIELLKTEDHPLETKSILLIMMVESRPLIQEAFISNGGLSVLDDWLAEENPKLTTLVLKLLYKLPVDMQALKDNGSIGKTVGKLTTSDDPKTKKQAKAVLKAWKRLVDRAVQAKTKKRKQLPGKEEPTSKIPRISSSNAFRKSNSSTTTKTSDLNVVKVKRTTVEPKDNQSNKVNPTTKPDYKPLSRLIDKNDTTTFQKKPAPIPQRVEPLRRSSGGTIVEEPFVMPDLSRKPSSSCLPNPEKKKKARSISWAPDESLVRVKLFRRDKSLALNNPGMQMIKARIAQAQAQAQVQQKKPEPPTMRPSIRWRAPVPINLPASVKVGRGENSSESAIQRERERTALKARYPDARHIPPTPGNENLRETPLRDEDIAVIPLEDLMKQPVQPAAPHSYPSPPPYDSYNTPPPQSQTAPYYPAPASQAPESNTNDILRALQSGILRNDLVQSLLVNPNEQNTMQLRNLLATVAPQNNYPPPAQQRPPQYPNNNSYPNYPPAGQNNYSHHPNHNAPQNNYNQYPPAKQQYYPPPNGRYPY